MTDKEFTKFIKQNRKEVEKIMQDIEEASNRFDEKVKEFRQHC